MSSDTTVEAAPFVTVLCVGFSGDSSWGIGGDMIVVHLHGRVVRPVWWRLSFLGAGHCPRAPSSSKIFACVELGSDLAIYVLSAGSEDIVGDLHLFDDLSLYGHCIFCDCFGGHGFFKILEAITLSDCPFNPGCADNFSWECVFQEGDEEAVVFWLRHLGLDPQVIEVDEEVGYSLLGSTLDVLDSFLSFASEEPILEVVVGVLEEFFEREGVVLENCFVVLAIVSGPLFATPEVKYESAVRIFSLSFSVLKT